MKKKRTFKSKDRCLKPFGCKRGGSATRQESLPVESQGIGERKRLARHLESASIQQGETSDLVMKSRDSITSNGRSRGSAVSKERGEACVSVAGGGRRSPSKKKKLVSPGDSSTALERRDAAEKSAGPEEPAA